MQIINTHWPPAIEPESNVPMETEVLRCINLILVLQQMLELATSFRHVIPEELELDRRRKDIRSILIRLLEWVTWSASRSAESTWRNQVLTVDSMYMLQCILDSTTKPNLWLIVLT